MTIEELIDWAKHRGYYEEITPEDIANAMFQQGSITLSEYLEIIEELKEINK